MLSSNRDKQWAMQKGRRDETSSSGEFSVALSPIREDGLGWNADDHSSKTSTEKHLMHVVTGRLLMTLQDTFLWKGAD